MHNSAQQGFLGHQRRKGNEDKERKWICALFAIIMISILSTGSAVDEWKAKVRSRLELLMEGVEDVFFSPKAVGADAAMRAEGKRSLQSMAEESPIIVVDAGHGGKDGGCSRAGVNEKDINLAIAKMVEEKLVGMGYQVIMTREDDRYLAVKDRVRMANESGAKLYISIHQNAFEDESIQGIEVWYNEAKGGEANKRVALLLRQQTIEQTGAMERALKDDSQMYGVIHTTMPACLIETGFLSNRREREKLVTTEYQEQLAQGIAQAVEYYYHPKTM